jgi:hypothetical protein
MAAIRKGGLEGNPVIDIDNKNRGSYNAYIVKITIKVE